MSIGDGDHGEVTIDRRLLDRMFHSGQFDVAEKGDTEGTEKETKETRVKSMKVPLQIGGLSARQLQMILDTLDVASSSSFQDGDQSMAEFFQALESWQRHQVQSIDVFALRVHSEELLQKVRKLRELVTSVTAEFEKCLPRMHFDLRQAKEKLYPALIRPESGLKAAIRKQILTQRMSRVLGDSRRKKMMQEVEKDLERYARGPGGKAKQATMRPPVHS